MTRKVRRKRLIKVRVGFYWKSNIHTIVFVQIIERFSVQNTCRNAFLILRPDDCIYPPRVQGTTSPPSTKYANKPQVGDQEIKFRWLGIRFGGGHNECDSEEDQIVVYMQGSSQAYRCAVCEMNPRMNRVWPGTVGSRTVR